MSSQLILYKPEINLDVFFEQEDLWTNSPGTMPYDLWRFRVNPIYNTQVPTIYKSGLASGTATLSMANTNLKPGKTYKWKLCVLSNQVLGGVGQSTVMNIGGINYTVPVTLTQAIYEGSITASNTNISFTATSGMDAQINWLKIVEDPSEYTIDLTDDIDVPLTFLVADVREPAKRNASKSRTVTIPATKNNNLFFNHIYEIGGDGTFNPNKKVKCAIYNDGLLQFEGICKLDYINRQSNGINNYTPQSYDITLLGSIADLFYEIGDTLISELDYSEYDHTYSRAEQRRSWYNGIIKYGSVYANVMNGSFLTISSCSNNGGRVQMNFSSSHGLVAGDWLLIPENSILNVGLNDPKNWYLGEHLVYSVISSTSVVLQCGYYDTAGSIATKSTGTDRVRKHSKKGEGYVYPMIDYDMNNGSIWDSAHFFTAIYAYEILKKIFKKAKYTWNSSVLESVLFKKMIVPSNSGTLKISDDVINSRLFRAQSISNDLSSFQLAPVISGGIYLGHKWNNGLAAPAILDIPIADDSSAGFFDSIVGPGGNFNTATYRYICPATGIYNLSIEGLLDWCWLKSGLNASATQNDGGGGAYNTIGQLSIEIYDYNSNTVIASAVHAPDQVDLFSSMPNNTTVVFNPDVRGTSHAFSQAFNNLLLTAGDQYGVRARVLTLPEKKFQNYSGNITIQYGIRAGCIFENSITNTNVQEGDTVYMNSLLPKVKCSDFLNTVIKMFHLYLDVDKNNERCIYIESRDEFYAAGQDINWTDKLDSAQKMQIIPMGELRAKYYNYNYKEDKDFYNQDHLKVWGSIYGNKKHEVDNDWLRDNYDTDLIFSSTVLTDTVYGRVTSNIQGSIDSNSATQPTTGNIRILYFNCASNKGSNGWWHTIGGANVNNIDYNYYSRLYPYAGHLDKPWAPYNDLNFDYPRAVYFDFKTWTDRNLFNMNYKKAVQETTDKNSKIVIARFHLKAYDIFKLDLRDRIEVDRHFFRINKISDFLVNKNFPVEVELLKIEDKPPFVTDPLIWEIEEVGQGYNPQGRSLNNSNYPVNATEANNARNGRQRNSVEIIGLSSVGSGSRNVSVIGDDNRVGFNCETVVVAGNNNRVADGLRNVFILNTSGVDVTESNITYINGVLITDQGLMNKNIVAIDAGQDQILDVLRTSSIINLIDAGKDEVYGYDTLELTHTIDGGEDKIL